jgi:hypothetical protein
VFAMAYTGDVLFNTALGRYQPSTCSMRELIIDSSTSSCTQATGMLFDRMQP